MKLYRLWPKKQRATIKRDEEPLQITCPFLIHFVTAPYAVPGIPLAMLFFYNGLTGYICLENPNVSGQYAHWNVSESFAGFRIGTDLSQVIFKKKILVFL